MPCNQSKYFFIINTKLLFVTLSHQACLLLINFTILFQLCLVNSLYTNCFMSLCLFYALSKTDTWELFDRPNRHKTIGVKWVYKTKLKENYEIDKYKAHLVAKGYKQEFGVDYKEVFVPVARHDTIRLVIALINQNSCYIYQLDVKSTFLHGDLK